MAKFDSGCPLDGVVHTNARMYCYITKCYALEYQFFLVLIAVCSSSLNLLYIMENVAMERERGTQTT